MSYSAAVADGAALMDPQQDREDSTEGSGESEEAAEAPAADDAASAGPYAQAALQSLLAYDSAIAQQVSEIAAEQRAVPGTCRLAVVTLAPVFAVSSCEARRHLDVGSIECGLAFRCNSKHCQHICAQRS